MMTLRGYFSRHVDILRSNGKETTALNYWSAWRMVSKYLGGQAGKFRLSAITEEWVRGYLRWLYARGNLKPSSINFYFRCVCALYGYAVKEKLISPVRNPFAGLCPTVPPTCKRTLSETDLCKIVSYSGCSDAKKTRLQACDIFLFLFYTRGMCFVDVYNLKKSNINGDYICYSRSKTEAPLQVKIIPEVRVLIDKYADAESDYLFPFLRENRRGEGEISEKSALRRLNRGLVQLGKELGFTRPLTTYVARHSWASMVESCGMNTAVISQGLGHSSERVTRIYMKGMPSHVIDKANEEMLNQTVRLRQKRNKGLKNLKNKERRKKIKGKRHLLGKKGTFIELD